MYDLLFKWGVPLKIKVKGDRRWYRCGIKPSNFMTGTTVSIRWKGFLDGNK